MSVVRYLIEQYLYGKDFDQLKSSLDDLGIDHDISYSPSRDKIHISKIIVKRDEHGVGKGSKAMQLITKHADKHGKMITLTPSTDFGATSISRLKSFYKLHGFIENKGKNKDFSTVESMYRIPK